MEKHRIVQIVGVALFALGFFWGGTSYVTYPDDWGRTLSENAVWLGLWAAGLVTLIIGARMGDGK